MTELEQQELLKRLVHDIGMRAGCKVGWYPCSKVNARGFHIKVLNPPPSRSSKKNVFVYGTTTARLGCLRVSTWKRCLKNANWSKMSNWKKDNHWGEAGIRWDIYQTHSKVYDEVVYALSIACRYCLA